MNDANDREYVEACEEVDRLLPETPPITPKVSPWNAAGRKEQSRLDWLKGTAAYQDARIRLALIKPSVPPTVMTTSATIRVCKLFEAGGSVSDAEIWGAIFEPVKP